MKPQTKTKIRMAVKDYFEMFPKDWEEVKPEIERIRQNKLTDFAEIKGQGNVRRALFSVPEKLSAMIGMKLNDEERMMFTEKENARWFAKEYPQFRITDEI